MGKVKACVRLSDSGFRSISFIKECVYQYQVLKYKTIGDGGITVDFWIIKVRQITGIIVYLESSNFFGSFTSILSFEMTLRPSDHERQYQLVLSRNSSIDYMATTCLSRRSAALNLP